MKYTFIPKILVTLLLFAGFFTKTQAQISTATITIKDTSKPATTSSASPAAFCTGSSTDLTVGAEGVLGTGASWKWYEAGCGTGTVVGTGATITVSPTNTGTAPITKKYYVRAEGDCNTTICDTVEVTINPTPQVTAPTNKVYCKGSTAAAISLVGTPTGITYDISGGADVGLNDINNQTQIPSFTATNTTANALTRTITITPKANGCTGAAVTYTITVFPTVTVDAVDDTTLCANTSTNAVNFTSSSTTTGTVTYKWTNNNTATGLTASGTGNIPSFTATNTTCANIESSVTVTPIYSIGTDSCSGTPITFKYIVRPIPNGSIAGNGPVCQGGGQLTFTAANCVATGPYTLDIRQTVGSGTPTTVTYNSVASGTAFNVNPQPAVGTTVTYDLMKITDANGCVRQ